MRMFGSVPPRKPNPTEPDVAGHSDRLHKAIQRAASTNVQMLEVTTSKSLDQIEQTNDIINTIRNTVARIQSGVVDTSQETMDLLSRKENENHS